MRDKDPQISVAEFKAMCAEDTRFLDVFAFETTQIAFGRAVCSLPFDMKHVRPGDTVGGPAIMALADFTLWAAVVGAYGPMAEMAVTTNLSVNFLRPAGLSDLHCEAELVKAGRRLAVGVVTVSTRPDGDAIAHVTGTYSIPPG